MQKASTRRRKAYWAATKVAWSYFSLYLRAKVFGKAYWDKRVPAIHERCANEVRRVMLELQGLFIKAGQLISTLSNVLPEAFRTPLEQLQDNVPPHPFTELEALIEQELGRPVSELFSEIDPNPIAAASIGQAHRAKIGDKPVVVKIQHPKVDELARVDLAIIKRIVGWVARFMKIKGIEHLYQQVEQMIEEELDYLKESISMQRIKANLQLDQRVKVPQVYQSHTSKKVLTMEYCEGVKISDLEQLKAWNLNPQKLAETLVEVYCQMILGDGFYHADPHPGNVLVAPDGRLVLLDFGAVAQLSDKMKKGIPTLLQAMIKQDTEAIVRILRNLGFLAPGDDAKKVAEKLADAVQDFVYNDLQMENLNMQQISPEQMQRALQLINVKELTRIMQIPKDWVLLNRAVVLVGGVIFILSPDWNPIDTVEPYIRRQMVGTQHVAEVLLKTLKNQFDVLVGIPTDLQKTLDKVNKGKVVLEVKSMEKGLPALQMVLQQLVWMILFLTSTYFYVALLQPQEFLYLRIAFAVLGGLAFLRFCWLVMKTPKV